MKVFLAFFLVSILIITVSGKRCKNISKDCEKKVKLGWCSKNQYYAAMGRLCQKACKMCDKKSNVYDIDARCNKWKISGYCEANAHSLYMYRSCKFSCPKLVKAFTEGEE